MKSNQRLDYDRLAEALRERKLLDAETLRHVLHQCQSTGALFPELLVRENLVADWELARVSCEVFGLPYLPVDVYEPDADLLKGLDPALLRQFALVPLDRYGDLLVVAMPAMVPSSVLAELEERASCRALPVVGSVAANRAWLEVHLPKVEMPDMAALAGGLEDALGFLDEGDAAVRSEESPGGDDVLSLDLDLALGDGRQREDEAA